MMNLFKKNALTKGTANSKTGITRKATTDAVVETTMRKYYIGNDANMPVYICKRLIVAAGQKDNRIVKGSRMLMTPAVDPADDTAFILVADGKLLNLTIKQQKALYYYVCAKTMGLSVQEVFDKCNLPYRAVAGLEMDDTETAAFLYAVAKTGSRLAAKKAVSEYYKVLINSAKANAVWVKKELKKINSADKSVAETKAFDADDEEEFDEDNSISSSVFNPDEEEIAEEVDFEEVTEEATEETVKPESKPETPVEKQQEPEKKQQESKKDGKSKSKNKKK